MLIEIINSMFKIMAVSGNPRFLPVVSSELNQTKITKQPTKYFTIILAKCHPSRNDQISTVVWIIDTEMVGHADLLCC